MGDKDTRTPGLTDPKEIAEKRKENEASERIATMKDSSAQAFLEFKVETNARLDRIEKFLEMSKMKTEKKPNPKPEREIRPSGAKDTSWEVSKD